MHFSTWTGHSFGTYTYLVGSAPLKYALIVSVKAAATGRVSWGPMVRGLGPLEHPETHRNTKNTHKASIEHVFSAGLNDI